MTPCGRASAGEAGGGISGIIAAPPSGGGTVRRGEGKEKLNMKNKDLRRLRCLVKAQTLWHLERLAYLDGCGDVGRMVDKLTRDKVLALRQSAVGPWAGRYVAGAKRVD